MSNRKRILLIAYHYYPDPAVGAKRVTALAKYLEEKGLSVTVLTKKLDKDCEKKRKALLNENSRIISIYQHPGFINPAWLWLKEKKYVRNGVKPIINKGTDAGVDKKIDSAKSAQSAPLGFKSLLMHSIKKSIISAQSIFDAKKSWLALAVFKVMLLKLKGEKFDLIISSGPPNAVHVVALYCKKFLKTNWIMETRDPINVWSEVYPLCKAAFRISIENRYEKLFYQESNRIIVTTESLGREVEAERSFRSEKIDVIYNGYDGAAIEERTRKYSKIRVVYAGSLYLNRNPFNFLETVKLLKVRVQNLPDFCIEFYGDCASYDSVSLHDWIIKNGLTDIISIMGSVESDALNEIYSESDILLNFAQNQKKQIPAKTFEYLKYDALPVVITEPDSDVAGILNDSGLGVVLNDDQEEIYRFLESYLRSPDSFSKRKGYSKRIMFSRELQNKKYYELVEETL